MKRLTPDKRNKLLLVILGTVAIIVLVYFFLIDPQNQQNRKLAAETAAEAAKLQNIKQTVRQGDAIATAAGDITTLLARAEDDMVSGDINVWLYDTMRQFKASHHVDIGNISQPAISDVDILPGFPFRQIRFQISGTGYYHDIGKFVADFENKFPHARILNLGLESNNLGAADAGNEKLSFHMEIAALIKPNA